MLASDVLAWCSRFSANTVNVEVVKNFVFSLVSIVTLGATPSLAQELTRERPNAVVADLGMHVVNIGYQRTLNRRVALQASAGLYAPWTVNSNVFGLAGGDHDPPGDVIGAVLRGRAFVFLVGAAPGGLWVSPFAQAGVVTATVAGRAQLGPTWAVGVSAGYTFVIARRVLIALGLGAQYHVAAPAGSAVFPGFARFSPTVDINVGYAF